MTYGELMGSMVHLVKGKPILRRRAFYQGCLFFAFSLFWTTRPRLLAAPHYGLTQNGIALFALAGVSGAIAAPIGGRVADRGWGCPATGGAIALVAVAMFASILIPQGSTVALSLLVVAAIAIDCGVQANLVLGFRAIFPWLPTRAGASTALPVDGVRGRSHRLSARRMGLRARGMGANMLCWTDGADHCASSIPIGVAIGKE
jgi:nitrate/nitrite transporter NarK